MPRSSLSIPLLFLACCMLLSSCADRSPGAPGAEHEQAEAFRLSGYRAGPAQELQQWQATWSLSSGAVDVLLLQLRHVEQPLPVVLYLPGLGETARSGEAWRRGWAEAGYAVLSIQALEDGPAVYRSSEAQAGALQALHQRYFSSAARSLRLQRIHQALAQVVQRAKAREAGFAQLDLQRLAVAGFDLGAQSAAALLTEGKTGEPSVTPLVAILLGPYVEANDDLARFATLDKPLLVVTGAQDDAPLSWQAPGHRQRLWQSLPPRGHYQLLVEGDHPSLAGNDPIAKHARERRGERGGGRPAGGPPPSGRPMPLASFAGADAGAPPTEHSRSAPPGVGHSQGMPVDPRQSVAIQAVSLAFLDARLQGLNAARQWLDNGADVWLSGVAELQHK